MTSTLAAPDALNEIGQTIVIDGSSAATLSQFVSFDRTTRNAGAEGGDAASSLMVYGVRVIDEVPDKGGSLVEYGSTGTASSQALITRSLHGLGRHGPPC